jgi:hypothetical protein
MESGGSGPNNGRGKEGHEKQGYSCLLSCVSFVTLGAVDMRKERD